MAATHCLPAGRARALQVARQAQDDFAASPRPGSEAALADGVAWLRARRAR